MRLRISHRTFYQYDRVVRLQPHLLYLRPRENPLLKVHKFELKLDPDGRVSWMRDDFDNLPASVAFVSPAESLSIETESDVTTDDVQPFDFLVRDYAASFPFAYEPLHRFNLGLYLIPPESAAQEEIRKWMLAVFPSPPRETIAWLSALARTIRDNLGYERREIEGIQLAQTTIARGVGSCRDFAALFVACARTLGVAARFVSGYMFDANVTSDGGEMHAWVEVFLPGAGWRAVDPTYGIFCHNAHIPVAHAVVAESVNPIQGAFQSASPARATLSTRVRIQLLDQWQPLNPEIDDSSQSQSGGTTPLSSK